MRFDGKIVVVTGGASGIGAACVAMFAQRGGTVVVADKNVDGASAVASGVGARPIELDVGEEDSVRAAEAAIRDWYGRGASVLVNCAGILQRTLPPERLSMKEWDLVQKVDLRGTYLCCAVFGATMAASGGGAIVNIASVAGMGSGPLHSYGPAKAGVINLGECLAAEWGHAGVRVNTVSPGFTRTPAVERGIEKKVLAADAMSSASAMGRLLEPAEIAAAVGFLASDLASGVTGVNLPVDVGYLVATPWMSYGGLRQAH